MTPTFKVVAANGATKAQETIDISIHLHRSSASTGEYTPHLAVSGKYTLQDIDSLQPEALRCGRVLVGVARDGKRALCPLLP